MKIALSALVTAAVVGITSGCASMHHEPGERIPVLEIQISGPGNFAETFDKAVLEQYPAIVTSGKPCVRVSDSAVVLGYVCERSAAVLTVFSSVFLSVTGPGQPPSEQQKEGSANQFSRILVADAATVLSSLASSIPSSHAPQMVVTATASLNCGVQKCMTPASANHASTPCAARHLGTKDWCQHTTNWYDPAHKCQ